MILFPMDFHFYHYFYVWLCPLRAFKEILIILFFLLQQMITRIEVSIEAKQQKMLKLCDSQYVSEGQTLLYINLLLHKIVNHVLKQILTSAWFKILRLTYMYIEHYYLFSVIGTQHVVNTLPWQYFDCCTYNTSWYEYALRGCKRGRRRNRERKMGF